MVPLDNETSVRVNIETRDRLDPYRAEYGSMDKAINKLIDSFEGRVVE